MTETPDFQPFGTAVDDFSAVLPPASGTPRLNATAVCSVSQLNLRVQQALEASFPLLWVAGEVSNLVRAASGHLYFLLKDERAQVRCVMFRQRAQLLGWALQNGQRVEARALVSLYAPRGEFQLGVEALRQAGQGNLYEQFLLLKAQLAQEGCFDSARKRPLPAFPRRIGVLSSLQAAALRDVLVALARRAPHIEVIVAHAPVQGEGAGLQLAQALTRLARQGGCDVLLVCRGGGSIEDLWAFNDPVLVRAMVASPVPVISGVGHETDVTLADFAADLRAATPTAAAELAAPVQRVLQQGLLHLQQRLEQLQQQGLARRMQQIDQLGFRLRHPAEGLRHQRLQLQAEGQRLQALMQRQLARSGLQLPALRLRLRSGLQQSLQRRQAAIAHLRLALQHLNPQAVLERGYALVRDAKGRVVAEVGDLEPGAQIVVYSAGGHAEAQVRAVHPKR